MRSGYLWDDPDDEWSRLRQALAERQARYQNEVLSGQLSPERYAEFCGRYNELKDILGTVIREVRRGLQEASPRQQPYERLPHVEE